MKKRLLGVTILGTLFLPWGAKVIFDVYSVWRSLLGLMNQGVLDPHDPLVLKTRMESIAVVALGLAWFVAGIGVLIRKNWACLLASVIAGISILGELRAAIPMVFQDRYFPPVGDPLWLRELLRWAAIWFKTVLILAWYGVIIWYFLRPSVKAQFVQQE